MRLVPTVRARSRLRPTAGIEALVGMGLLCGAALMLLPGMAALATFTLIAATARTMTRKPRAAPAPARIR